MCSKASGCEEQLNLIKQFPDKAKELKEFMDSLPLGEDTEENRGYLIQSLHKAQGLFGYLHSSLQVYVAERLGLHLSEVYGVISFYSYFTDKPTGKYKINVCTGTACFVKGAGKLLEEFSRFLHIREGKHPKMKCSRLVDCGALVPVHWLRL